MSQWIAEAHVILVRPDGRRTPGRIAVGLPVVREQDCACEVVIDGLEPPRNIYGHDTLQALLLALRFIGMRLDDVCARGLRIELDGGDGPPGTDVLAAYFGPLLAPPGSSSRV